MILYGAYEARERCVMTCVQPPLEMYYSRVNVKGGLCWTVDWTVDWTGLTTRALQPHANFFFGPTFDLENFPTSGVKGRVLLEATPPVGHLLLQLRSSTLEGHKATTRTALLNR